jgi:hypothetical protein
MRQGKLCNKEVAEINGSTKLQEEQITKNVLYSDFTSMDLGSMARYRNGT